MKKVLLIGKFDDATKEIGDSFPNEYMVMPCSEEQVIIEVMLETEKLDLIVVSLSGSAVAAREMFAFLRPAGVPILGIGSDDNQAELFINGYLSDPKVRFLTKPAAPEDILKNARILLGEEEEQEQGKPDFVEDDEPVPEGERATVLLVDDSPGYLRAMQAILSTRYKVNFATSGAQAIAAVAKDKPDIILLDYEMPVCDGRMTLQMLRSEEDTKDIPVVFLTGISDAKYVSRVMELRPQGYLLKPCSEDVVFAMIKKVLKESGK